MIYSCQKNAKKLNPDSKQYGIGKNMIDFFADGILSCKNASVHNMFL